MHSTTYDKKIFSPGVLFRHLGFLIAKAPAVFRVMRNPDIARSMVASYAMDANLGRVSYATETSSFPGNRTPEYFERSYSEAMDGAVREVSARTLEIPTDKADILEKAASRLLEVEMLNEPALRDLAQGLRAAAADKPKVAANE